MTHKYVKNVCDSILNSTILNFNQEHKIAIYDFYRVIIEFRIIIHFSINCLKKPDRAAI